jgi:hypothetical protein
MDSPSDWAKMRKFKIHSKPPLQKTQATIAGVVQKAFATGSLYYRFFLQFC